jgi:hypothetical protein
MATSTRKHRVIQYAIVDGFVPPEGCPVPPGRQHDNLNFSLSDARPRIQTCRLTADVFHPYEFTDRDGIPMHVAYARYLPGSPKNAHGQRASHLDITYVYELTADAVAASFGLSPTT